MGLTHLARQHRAAASLSSALSRSRLAAAYLFSGPEGSGKREVALELARAALCENPSGGGACGQCWACLAITDGRHPDVSSFRPEDGKASYPVRQVREEIRRNAYLKPARGRRRFLIIEKAEALVRGSGGQNEGADTLLKLLEEPPVETVLVLLAAHPERLPETVLSRCQQVRFDPPEAGELAAALAGEENLDPAMALFVVSLAGGDLEAARGLVRGKKKDKPDLESVRRVLLTILRSVGGLSYPDLSALASALDAAAKTWPVLTGALGVLAALYRDAALLAAGKPGDGAVGDGAAVLAFPGGPEAEAVLEAAGALRPAALRRAALRALQAQEDSRRSPARLLFLEVLLLDLAEICGATLGVSS